MLWHFCVCPFLDSFHQGLSSLKYISHHGNSIILDKTIYCPWKSIQDKIGKENIQRAKAILWNYIETQLGFQIPNCNYSFTNAFIYDLGTTYIGFACIGSSMSLKDISNLCDPGLWFVNIHHILLSFGITQLLSGCLHVMCYNVHCLCDLGQVI